VAWILFWSAYTSANCWAVLLVEVVVVVVVISDIAEDSSAALTRFVNIVSKAAFPLCKLSIVDAMFSPTSAIPASIPGNSLVVNSPMLLTLYNCRVISRE
jgi:hypothetical protein